MLNNKFIVWLLRIGIYLGIGAWCLVIILFRNLYYQGYQNSLVIGNWGLGFFGDLEFGIYCDPSAYACLRWFPLKGPFEQTSDEFRVSYPLNFDGSGQSCLGRDVWVGVDF